MSWKQGLDCYTDNIKVKISEKYKPPPRINLPMTYAQRLILNKQTQESNLYYDFGLENNVSEVITICEITEVRLVSIKFIHIIRGLFLR
nr:unnamed protein product [Callosobruchus chinensis]